MISYQSRRGRGACSKGRCVHADDNCALRHHFPAPAHPVSTPSRPLSVTVGLLPLLRRRLYRA